jgi:hypothetical protein
MQLPNPQLARLESRSIDRNVLAKRRSSRVALKMPIGLAGEDYLKSPFTMPARATNLNRHGATIQLTRKLSVGSIVLVRNSRGVSLGAE